MSGSWRQTDSAIGADACRLSGVKPTWPSRAACPRPSNPMMERPGANSEEKHETAGDIDTVWWIV